MKKKKIIKKILLLFTVLLIVVILPFGSFYTYWNSASPNKTCASCHEIESSVHLLTQSAHRQMYCKECHGTALSNGFHSLKEKSMMVVNHVKEERVENIRMNEKQLLKVMNNCIRCHSSEYANWKSGGHSASYKDIFLNENHNKTERLNSDCLRCHGMFFEGATSDIVKPVNKKGPWQMNDLEKANQPTIPCMACHQIHIEGRIVENPNYANPQLVFYSRKSPESNLSFYDRHEKVNFSSSDLPKLQLVKDGKPVKVSDDYKMRNCVQCHAPNSWHEAGTSDDKTPRGVHEGLSCLACHSPHSNEARNSCITCHPTISNCGIDVTKMNTTYSDKNSPNNIHTVSCNNCHQNMTRSKSSLN